MADQLQLRGGTTTEHSTFTGALREVTVDTTKKTLVVHDATNAGGTPLAKENLSNVPNGTITSAMIADGTIVDADINSTAAIAKTKISGTAITAADTGTVTSAMIADGTIVNADINATAAIDKTKISGTAITAADSGTVTNAMLAGSIDDSKLSTISTAGKVSNSATTASSTNVASSIVARDANGSFTANIVTANLTGNVTGNVSGNVTGNVTGAVTGNASTATALATPRNIQGVAFDGTSNVTVVTAGTGISVTGTAVANTGVLSVNGNSGAITNVAVTNSAQSFSAAQRGAISALTSAATITPDLSVANNYSLSLGVNTTLANPTNITAGQSGTIVITNGGSFTMAFGSYWKFPGGTAPTLTSSGVDVLAYYVESATRITARMINDVK